jgi:hypothetical protein
MGRTPRHVALEFGHNAVADFLKSCEDDMRDPHSGFAQMRTNENRWEIWWCLYGLFLVVFLPSIFIGSLVINIGQLYIICHLFVLACQKKR